MKDELLIGPENKVEEICVIKATKRQVLIDGLRPLINSSFYDGSDDKIYLSVSLSGEQVGCEGNRVDYATEADIPFHSVPCSCGNPKHWLIKYSEECV